MSTRRPDVFSREEFQTSLRAQGCPESFVAPITSDFRLFVPLVLEALGPERVFRIAKDAQVELGLGDQDAAWQTAAKYIHGWAAQEVLQFKERRQFPRCG